ncbi:MAG: hypothetical protein JSW50_04960, partial [Candidatus Latescibacterota bacterium]
MIVHGMRIGALRRALAIGFLVIGLAAPPLAGPVTAEKGFAYPDGPSGEIARAYVEAFSSGADSLMIAFHESYLSEKGIEEASIKTRMWEYRRLHNMLGTLLPHSVVKNDDSSLVLMVKSKKLDTWFQLGIEMDADSTGMVLDVDL